MSSVVYVMLCGARDRSCAQQEVGTFSTFLELDSDFLAKNLIPVVFQALYSLDRALCDF